MVQKAATHSIVIPVMNRKCSVPTGIPIALSEDFSFRKIRGDDLAVITEHNAEAASYLNGGKFTLTIDNHEYIEGTDNFSNKILCASFVLNVISSDSALAFDKAFILRSQRSTKIVETRSVTGHHHAYQAAFAITSKDILENVSTLYESVSAAVDKHAALKLTIARLNSAAGRLMIDEKIVDLCIALESVFQSQTEISFQFALYNTILAEPDLAKRLEIFQLLKKLYGQRSNIVHGNKDVDAEWCTNNFTRLLTIAKTSVLQKIDFLTNNNHTEWKAGLESRALGII